MLVAPPPRLKVDQLGGELAQRGRDGQQLQAANPLGSSALVDVDVRGLGADDRIPSLCHRLQRDDVGAGPVEDRVCRGIATEVLLEDALQALGIDVGAVGHLVPTVGPGDGLEDFGVDARVVVAGESSSVGVVQR